MQTGRELLELLGKRHFIAHQHDGTGDAVVALGDVLQQPHVHGIFEIGMKVEQHVDARHGSRLQVLQELLGIGESALRAAEVDVDALQALSDGPLEYSPAATLPYLEAHFSYERQHARLLARFHHDEGQAGGQQSLQLAAWVWRCRWGVPGARSRNCSATQSINTRSRGDNWRR